MMFELFIPFIMPALAGLIVWLIGLPGFMIGGAVLAVLFLQFLMIWLVEAASSRRKKPHALPELPNCRCGGSLKSTRRGKGYRCRSCNRLYQFASGSNEHFKFVEKLATGYTLAYLKTEKGQA